MATRPNMPMLLSKDSQKAVVNFNTACYTMINSQWNLREQMRLIDLIYMRENDRTKENQRAKVYNRYGDADKLQNLTVPIVMPQVESAVTYQTSVFLTGVPLFGIVADPANEDAAMQLESVIDENATRGGWVRELTMTFRDGFKYNLAPIEVAWGRKVTAALETDISFSAKQAKPKEVIWEGNTLKRLDPYNTIWDTRVAPTDVPTKGEFAGYTELMSRIALKQFIEEMPDKLLDNIKAAFESGFGGTTANGGVQSFYVPSLNPAAMLGTDPRMTTNWMSWAGVSAEESKIKYKDMYEVTILYARILPIDFKLNVPGRNTPQIWKFVIVNHQVVIYAERQTNAHNMIPILICQPLEDGLRYQTKSLANNVRPMQEISSTMMNSVLAARRRAISDRGLFDPSRVSPADINSANPSAKIPVKPAAYGKPLNESYYPIPFNDDQSAMIMQQLPMFNNYANTISGQNPVKQGQFVKGNKTQKEFSDVMANANGRDQTVSLLLEAQLFTPMKEILKSNVLQYQGGTTIFNRAKSADVSIDPLTLRKALLNFKISDGLTPTDKLINADIMMVAMQQIGSSPLIGQGYNIAPLFSYLMKTQGAHLAPFEKSPQQMAYEQAMQQYQQTVLQLYKQNPEQDPAKLPPQPVPQQYGYDPTGNNVAQPGPKNTGTQFPLSGQQPQQ
jgi:hypothetical protein